MTEQYTVKKLEKNMLLKLQSVNEFNGAGVRGIDCMSIWTTDNVNGRIERPSGL